MSRPVEDEIEGRIEAARIIDAVRYATTEDQFRVLMLYLSGHSRQRIADEYGISRQAVGQLICRGLARVREWLEE